MDGMMDGATPTLPSVFELARCRVRLWADHDQADRAALAATNRGDNEAEIAAYAAMNDLTDEIVALERLIFTRPISSLSDIAAAAAVACETMRCLAQGSGAEKGGIVEEITALSQTLGRMACAAAHHAGISLATVAAEGSAPVRSGQGGEPEKKDG